MFRILGTVLALTLIWTTPVSLSAQAQGTGIREVSASATQPHPPSDPPPLHDDGRVAGGRGDP